MAKYNGSGILLYADGVEIAAQKGFTLNANVKLFDITTKQSSGWAEHDKGVRSADVSFDALQSTTGLSDDELFLYITSRKSLLITIAFTSVIIGEVDCSSMTINAPTEEATGLSGSFKFKGRLYRLAGTNVNLMQDPDAGGTDYDTMAITGTTITSAINLAGTAATASNPIDVVLAETFMVITCLTKNSGQFPIVDIIENGVGAVSNEVSFVEGVNIISLVITDSTINALLRIRNTAAANWKTSPIYLFKL